MVNRPAIPIGIKRRLLIESGYRCAIPTCRYPITENAHIFSWAESGDHGHHNLIALCPNCHTRYDSGEITKEAIIYYKKKLMFLNDVYSRFELDVLDYLKSKRRALIPGELLVKRLLEEGIVKIEDEIMTQGFADGEDFLGIFSVVLTEKGAQLLNDWARVDGSLTYDRFEEEREG